MSYLKAVEKTVKADVASQRMILCDVTSAILHYFDYIWGCYISGGETHVKAVIKHAKEVLIILPYLLLLFSIVLFLGVYRDMQKMEVQNEKLRVQLDKTSEKLDYYIYRDSTSVGHTEGPEGYEEYKKRLRR